MIRIDIGKYGKISANGSKIISIGQMVTTLCNHNFLGLGFTLRALENQMDLLETSSD